MKMTNSRIGPLTALTLLALLVSSPVTAETATAPRDFVLKGQGSLRLDVPKAWRSESTPVKDLRGVQVRIDASGKDPFQILMTAYQPRTRTKLSDDLKSIRKVVEGAAAQARKEAVEPKIPVRPFKVPDIAGYYISVTDKSPRRGDYKFMNQGLTRVGPLHMSFTILTNDATGKTMAAAMAVVRSATFKKSPAAQAEADDSIPKAHVIVVSKRENGFHLTVPVSRLTMTVPGKTFEQAEARKGAGNKSARYFYLRDPLRRLYLSGWFESSQDFKGVKEHWKKESAQFLLRNRDKPKNVRFEKVGKWDVIRYVMDTHLGKKLPRPVPNLRAHWVEAGTWIELHLSIAAEFSQEEAEGRLTAALKSIAVTQKK